MRERIEHFNCRQIAKLAKPLSLHIDVNTGADESLNGSTKRAALFQGIIGNLCRYLFSTVILLWFLSSPALAQIVRPLISGPIDETKLTVLSGNTHPAANAANDRGVVADRFSLDHMMLQLRRSSEQEAELEAFIDQLHDRNSPNFHKWLTAQEFGRKYGTAEEDLNTIRSWLTSHGFKIGGTYTNRMVIDFSGTAGQVREAFHTEIHHLEVNGIKHIANMSDPQIPAALAPAVAGIMSLNDFRPRTMHHAVSNYTSGNGSSPYLVVPADLATIYNFNPIFAAGYTGQGQTIVVIEDTDVYSTDDWNTFRTQFGLAAAYPEGSFTQVHPPAAGAGLFAENCTDPGAAGNGLDAEATIDAEWSSAAAPSAAIVLASCADIETVFGGFIALQNLVNASGTPPAIVSISYGWSEPENGAAMNQAINSLYQQAVSEGVSVFVASGNQLADGTDGNAGATYATSGISVNAFASTIYNVAVGGTDFGDVVAGTGNTYWSPTNGANYGSALSYIPEIPWNDSCAGTLLATYWGFSSSYGANGLCNSGLAGSENWVNLSGGSGGPSACATGAPSPLTPGVVSGTCAGYPKPSWQSVLGNPNDGVRDLPDVSLFSSNGFWGHYYVYCFSDTSNGGASCAGAPSTWAGAGGTSFASSIMAGIQALINQYTASSWGNPNPNFYSLARAEYGASGSSSCSSNDGNSAGSNCVFYDITIGDIDAPCNGANNCYTPSGTYGVLSTSNSSYQPAYAATNGWDFASGIGTINVYNLVTNFSSGAEVNGSCGTASGQASYSAPTSNLCSAGTVSAVAGNGPWNWTCQGVNGGTTASCSATLEVNGSCGAASGQGSYTAPTSNLCSAGKASAVTGNGPWTWTCQGVNGANANCSATLEVNGSCGMANNQNFFTPPASNLCSSGAASTVTGNGTWTWTCQGVSGGANANCSANHITTGIVVVSPTGGGEWTAGSKQTISWIYAGNIGAKVRIELVRGASAPYVIAPAVSIGSKGKGSYSWIMPAKQTPGSDYAIQVTSATKSNNYTGTGESFTISAPTITLMSPTAGESLTAGKKCKISWNYAGNPGRVAIYLMKDGSQVSTIISSAPSGSNGIGSYSWTIPNTEGSGTDYQVAVSSTSISGCTSISGNFTIIGPTISVTTPNGSNWKAGTKCPISWTYTGNPGRIAIFLMNGGSKVSTITPGASAGSNGKGSYSWTPKTLPPGAGYTVEVVSTANGSIYGVSSVFTIGQ